VTDRDLPEAAKVAVEAAIEALATTATEAVARIGSAPAVPVDPERDLALLRRFEPIVKYTQGELFFPMSAVPYIAQCELWAGASEREQELLVPLGELTAETLPSHAGDSPGKRQYLRFVQDPLSGADLARWRRRSGRPRFVAPSRLARVGILARLIDAGFDLSLLVRGKVPGGTMAAADVKYMEIRTADPRFVYHGRVVRQAGWTVCHYMFFYAANDWRSTFSGGRRAGPSATTCSSTRRTTGGPRSPARTTTRPTWSSASSSSRSGTTGGPTRSGSAGQRTTRSART
jgi:hypothetical protein